MTASSSITLQGSVNYKQYQQIRSSPLSEGNSESLNTNNYVACSPPPQDRLDSSEDLKDEGYNTDRESISEKLQDLSLDETGVTDETEVSPNIRDADILVDCDEWNAYSATALVREDAEGWLLKNIGDKVIKLQATATVAYGKLGESCEKLKERREILEELRKKLKESQRQVEVEQQHLEAEQRQVEHQNILYARTMNEFINGLGTWRCFIVGLTEQRPVDNDTVTIPVNLEDSPVPFSAVYKSQIIPKVNRLSWGCSNIRGTRSTDQHAYSSLDDAYRPVWIPTGRVFWARYLDSNSSFSHFIFLSFSM